MTDPRYRLNAWLAEQYEATLSRDMATPPEPPDSGLDALAERMRQTADACLHERERFDVDTAFYYPIAWLDVHCKRAMAQIDAVPPGATINLWIESPLGTQAINPRAWCFDVFDAKDPAKKIDILMTGAQIAGLNQFSFNTYSHPPQGLPTSQLRECTVDAWPLAPRVSIGVIGRACNGQNMELAMLNTSPVTISARVTVWGECPYDTDCLPRPPMHKSFV